MLNVREINIFIEIHPSRYRYGQSLQGNQIAEVPLVCDHHHRLKITQLMENCKILLCMCFTYECIHGFTTHLLFVTSLYSAVRSHKSKSIIMSPASRNGASSTRSKSEAPEVSSEHLKDALAALDIASTQSGKPKAASMCANELDCLR